jgi:hypothetical protein
MQYFAAILLVLHIQTDTNKIIFPLIPYNGTVIPRPAPA